DDRRLRGRPGPRAARRRPVRGGGRTGRRAGPAGRRRRQHEHRRHEHRRHRLRRGGGRVTAATGPVPILMYHSVAHAPSRAAHGLSVRPDAFAGQMAVLDAAGFVPLTTRELAAAWRDGRPLPPNPVLITFDDGYEGVHRHALPVLAARGFPSTVFVSTGWLRGEHETGGAPDLMLTWDQLRDLTEAGAEAGGHSHTH